jgi:cyclopropane fatty-acyl-phospholipid synthase-like methyltransferase
MDSMDYWAVAERDIEIQNPVTDRKMRLLEDYCDVRDGLKVLDVGCGKAWLMRQWAERYAIEGTGVELNPHFLRNARERSTKLARGTLEFVHSAALDFKPEPASYDIVLCLGASFALGGFVEAIEWMVDAARPGGSIVIGELILKHRPAVVANQVFPPDAVDSIAIIERHGAEVSATISASDADFERYVSHHRHNTLTWAREHPDHKDHAEMLKKSRDEWRKYLQTVRPHLGWTIFVGRKPG